MDNYNYLFIIKIILITNLTVSPCVSHVTDRYKLK